MLKFIVAIFITILLANINTTHAAARGGAKVEHLPSKILAEERELLIHLPNNYRRNTTLSYPVLYVLDGQRNVAHVAGTLDLLNQDNNA